MTADPGGANAGNALITANGSDISGGQGASISFDALVSGDKGVNAATATLIANGGSNGGGGGSILFHRRAAGGMPRVEVFGNGSLDLSDRTSTAFTLGSLEGDGLVYMGSTQLTVGLNNLNTTFSGVAQDDGGIGNGSGGSITKAGTGTLSLSGANTYTGSTTVSQGSLAARNRTGSATGSGAVQVNATLGGNGIIAGPVTVGGTATGGFIAPALGRARQNNLTLQSALIFKSNATYTCTFKARNDQARVDQVICNGLTIESGATFAMSGNVQGQLRAGLTRVVIRNASGTPIAGVFSNLPDGGTITVGTTNFQASYEGGAGNDLTLTVVQ